MKSKSKIKQKAHFFDQDVLLWQKRMNGDEVVIPKNTGFTIVVDYPVEKVFKFKIKPHKKNLRKHDIANIIVNIYNDKIYKNAKTEEHYGVWGHDIYDLTLSQFRVSKRKNGDILIFPAINS